ncbi:hypothetical protein [Streptacidiphilus sp. MAP5-3]
MAGSTPILVHNTLGCPPGGAKSGNIPNTSKPIVGNYPDKGQTSLYVIHGTSNGDILKWGITNDPAGRYSLGDFESWSAQYGGKYQMTIVRNFDTRDDALTLERYMTERVGGPENYEDWANTVPTGQSWREVYHEGVNLWQQGRIGPGGALP